MVMFPTSDFTTNNLANRLDEALLSFQVEEGANKRFSPIHTRIYAIIKQVEPAELSTAQEQLLKYMTLVARGESFIFRQQFMDLVLLLAHQNRWRHIFEKNEAIGVFKCLLVQALFKCEADESIIQNIVNNIVSEISGKTLLLNYGDRVGNACTALFGEAWWEVAAPFFSTHVITDDLLYSYLVNPSHGSDSNQNGSVTLPSSLI